VAILIEVRAYFFHNTDSEISSIPLNSRHSPLRHRFDDCKKQPREESSVSPSRDKHSTSSSAAWIGRPVYFTPAERRLQPELLQEDAARYECHVNVYALATNHAHRPATPQQSSGISFLMQRLTQRHVRTTNRTHHRTGTPWEGRYKAGQIDTESYLLTCMRHIEFNPLRVQMVAHPADYAWSSYPHDAGGITVPAIISHILCSLPGQDQASRCHGCRALLSARTAGPASCHSTPYSLIKS
jgi:REP element-mobilizing transposase RayT